MSSNNNNESICATPPPCLMQKGSWVGRLKVRVLQSGMDENLAKKTGIPESPRIDPSLLCCNDTALCKKECMPWRKREENELNGEVTEQQEGERCTPTETSSCLQTHQDPLRHRHANGYPQFTKNENDAEGSGMTIYDLQLFEISEESETPLQEHQINLTRDSKEPMNKTLKRLEISILKKLQQGSNRSTRLKTKRPKKSSNKKPNTDSIVWIRSTTPANKRESDLSFDDYIPWNVSDITNADMWSQFSVQGDNNVSKDSTQATVAISVSVPSEESDASAIQTIIPIEVQVCPPTIVTVQTFENFTASVFVGVPLVVETQAWFATHVTVDWFVDQKLVLKNSPCYTPTSFDIGKTVSVLLTPTRPNHDGTGCQEAFEFQNKVEPVPPMPIVSPLRQEWTQMRSNENRSTDIRVLSYNILADQNAYPRDYMETNNIYPWCDLKFLARTRRMPMIIYEILAYQPDVVCLQEVDMLVYETLLRPVLEISQNYQGYYSVKQTGSTREGCAMFWSLSCFEAVSEEEKRTIVIRDLFPTSITKSNGDDDDDWESMRHVAKLLQEHDNLRHVIRDKLGHVLQVTTLTARNSKQVVTLVNTHLFFHPLAGHIRVMQLLVSCHYLHKNKCFPFIFGGDFNLTSDSGGRAFLFDRTVSPNHESWNHLTTFTWEKETRPSANEESNNNNDSCTNFPTLSLPPSFPNMIHGYGRKDVPEFTHYISGFVETLDYIMVSEPSDTVCRNGLRPLRWAPMPSKQDIAKYVAMPNEFMPSDHISLVCDLEFTTTKEI